jgi:hypothetical protein
VRVGVTLLHGKIRGPGEDEEVYEGWGENRAGGDDGGDRGGAGLHLHMVEMIYLRGVKITEGKMLTPVQPMSCVVFS